jgi:hypothetical protein
VSAAGKDAVLGLVVLSCGGSEGFGGGRGALLSWSPGGAMVYVGSMGLAAGLIGNTFLGIG